MGRTEGLINCTKGQRRKSILANIAEGNSTLFFRWWVALAPIILKGIIRADMRLLYK
jgi:hypothetical protein